MFLASLSLIDITGSGSITWWMERERVEGGESGKDGGRGEWREG